MNDCTGTKSNSRNPEKFSSKVQLGQHSRIHNTGSESNLDSGERPYKCSKSCGKSFTQLSNLQNHQQICHFPTPGENRKKCSETKQRTPLRPKLTIENLTKPKNLNYNQPINPGRVTKIQFPVPQKKFVPRILKQKAKKTLRKEANSLSSVNELEVAFSKSPGNTHYDLNTSGEGADKSLASTCFSTTSNCTQNDLEVAFLKSPEVVFLKSVNYDEFKGGDSPDKNRAIKIEPFDSETEIEFREASKISQFGIEAKPEKYRCNYQTETLQDELSNAVKDFQFEPKVALEIGQLEIKNKPEEFRSNDQKETLEIETIEIKKDENSYEMEVQEDFELQLESDSDDDINEKEIDPPTMENKHDENQAQLSKHLNTNLDDLDVAKFLQDHALNHRLAPCDQTNTNIWCFVNVTLQAVMKTPSFYNVMKTLTYAGMKKKIMSKVYKMVTDFMTEFSPFEKKENENNLPVELYSSIFTKNMDLPLGMTYEARSFFQFLLNLTFLLNELNDEMLTTFKPVVLENEDLEEKNFEDNNSNQNLQGPSFGCIFQGQLQSREMTSTGHSTLILQPFFTLSLDIKSKNINNLTEAMLHYFVLNKNDGHFEELPTVLTIHLKRFIYDESGGCQKLLKDIEFPEDLKIPWDFLSNMNKYGGKQPTYRLFGIVYHSGEDVSDGHYVTEFNHPSLGWLHCDKGVMNSMPLRLRNSVPYILFYQNIDTLMIDPNSPTLKTQD